MHHPTSSLRLMFVVLVVIVGFQCIVLTRWNREMILMDNTKSQQHQQLHNLPTTRSKKKKKIVVVGGSSSTTKKQQQVVTKTVLPASAGSSSKKNMMKPNNDLKIVTTTVPGRQGFHLLKDMIDWNLSSKSKSNKQYTKTICTTSRLSYPSPTIRDMFTGIDEWSIINPTTTRRRQQQQQRQPNNGGGGGGRGRVSNNNNNNINNRTLLSCSNSLIRILFEQQTTDKLTQKQRNQLINEHTDGEQLTSCIVGGSNYNKAILTTLIQNQKHQKQKHKQHKQHSGSSSSSSSSSSFLLKDSIPITRIFNTTKECIEFCNNEWQQSQQKQQQQSQQKQQQQWIWKPKNSMQGKGIILIENLQSCRKHCNNNNNNDKIIGDGESNNNNLQAQMVADTMYLPDGRKFDVRSHILIANVNPLIVYTGAERVRICAESINVTNPTPYPYDDDGRLILKKSTYSSSSVSSSNKWNPFQQVCNTAVGKKHPIKGVWTSSKNVGPLSRGIPDNEIRNRIIQKLDQHNNALVELLLYNNNNNRWSSSSSQNNNKVGMFQVFAADYLIDTTEKIWFLELNKQPGFTDTGITFPNPWGDILQIEWTILQTYNNNYNNQNQNKDDDDDDDDWKTVLNERLSNLELEVLRRQQLDTY